MPNSSQRSFLRLLLAGMFAFVLAPQASADEAKRLRIGITLHPYYSYVAVSYTHLTLPTNREV